VDKRLTKLWITWKHKNWPKLHRRPQGVQKYSLQKSINLNQQIIKFKINRRRMERKTARVRKTVKLDARYFDMT
jgi:hypothetical protein